jgi:hypothetical protein
VLDQPAVAAAVARLGTGTVVSLKSPRLEVAAATLRGQCARVQRGRTSLPRSRCGLLPVKWKYASENRLKPL